MLLSQAAVSKRLFGSDRPFPVAAAKWNLALSVGLVHSAAADSLDCRAVLAALLAFSQLSLLVSPDLLLGSSSSLLWASPGILNSGCKRSAPES